MKYFKDFSGHNFIVNKKKCDNIFTFDIETTSVIKLEGKIYSAIKYDSLTDEQKENCTSLSSMYIWQLGIDDTVYYGRTWDDLKEFLDIIEKKVPEKKFFFVHNLRIRIPVPN